ncbi:MAG: hypothetical protein RL417_2236 [Pseudomonadota bacterium]|jgi:phosphoribosylaminoimidazolecarboxamide formyltransferase/IMP cyclohydrolase
MAKTALISVSDRTGLLPVAEALVKNGFTILATSGTTKFLGEAGIQTTPIETYTGQREILDGRVKTLHPKIHGGLLARRDDPKHLAELAAEGIAPIDIAIINLYPFVQNLEGAKAADPIKMIELIDVGGPTMLRAAAKNFRGVLAVIDPADYPNLIRYIESGAAPDGGLPDWRRSLAVKVFKTLAAYDLEIARYFAEVNFPENGAPILSSEVRGLGAITGGVWERAQALRYGENPHQRAAFYRPVGERCSGWEQLGGKELSYNNLLDFDATVRMVRSLPSDRAGAVIVKHLNPCGAAVAAAPLEALKRAKRGDPRSHFGGIIGFNRPVTIDVAEAIKEDFAEIVLAPEFTPEALQLLQKNKNLRLMRVDEASLRGLEIRSIGGGCLVQEEDSTVSMVREGEIVSKRSPSDGELNDLQFAWNFCAHVKSNAIVLVKDGMLIGVGAGQMSRIDSVELALSKARTHDHEIRGAVAASDAFFPFPDGLETLARAGVGAIVAPGGAKRDADVVSAADSLGVALVRLSDRHFRH